MTPRTVNGMPADHDRVAQLDPELREQLRADQRAAAAQQVVAVRAVAQRELP
jgi:hypothetical protein